MASEIVTELDKYKSVSGVVNHFNYNPRKTILSAPVLNMLYFYSYPYYPKASIGAINSLRTLFKTVTNLNASVSENEAKYQMRHDSFVEDGKNRYVIVESLCLGNTRMAVELSNAQERKELFSLFDNTLTERPQCMVSKDAALLLGDELRMHEQAWRENNVYDGVSAYVVCEELIKFLSTGNGSRLVVLKHEIVTENYPRVLLTLAVPGVISYNIKISIDYNSFLPE